MSNNNSHIRVYNNKCYGVEPSDYAKRYGFLDYKTLATIICNHVLNNEVIKCEQDHWEIENGDFEEEDDGYVKEVFQWYIIDDYGAEFLIDHTNEIVYYNEELDMYLWGITHFGTAWDYVLTDVKMIDDNGNQYVFTNTSKVPDGK